MLQISHSKRNIDKTYMISYNFLNQNIEVIIFKSINLNIRDSSASNMKINWIQQSDTIQCTNIWDKLLMSGFIFRNTY